MNWRHAKRVNLLIVLIIALTALGGLAYSMLATTSALPTGPELAVDRQRLAGDGRLPDGVLRSDVAA